MRKKGTTPPPLPGYNKFKRRITARAAWANWLHALGDGAHSGNILALNAGIGRKTSRWGQSPCPGHSSVRTTKSKNLGHTMNPRNFSGSTQSCRVGPKVIDVKFQAGMRANRNATFALLTTTFTTGEPPPGFSGGCLGCSVLLPHWLSVSACRRGRGLGSGLQVELVATWGRTAGHPCVEICERAAGSRRPSQTGRRGPFGGARARGSQTLPEPSRHEGRMASRSMLATPVTARARPDVPGVS